MKQEQKSENYISLQEATKYCEYSQEYLSLRARQKKLKAIKLGRNWVTTEKWLKEYLKKINDYKETLKFEKKVKVVVGNKPPNNLPIGDFQLVPIRSVSYRINVFLDNVMASSRVRSGLAFGLALLLIISGSIYGKESFKQVAQDIKDIEILQDYAEWVGQGIKMTPGFAEIGSVVDEIAKEGEKEITEIKEFADVIGEKAYELIKPFLDGLTRTYLVFNEDLNKVFSKFVDAIKSGCKEISEGYFAVSDFIDSATYETRKKISGWFEGFSNGVKFVVMPWKIVPGTKIVIDNTEIESLKNQVQELKEQGTIAKEVIKEIEVSKVIEIEKLEQTIKNYQYITIGDDDLAQLKEQIANLGVSTALTPNAPVYINTPGLQVGGHGNFETLGVSGLASVGGLGVGGGTTLGSISSDILTVNATSTFQELATFNKGISGPLGIGDASADATLEIVSGSGSAVFMVSSTASGNGDWLIIDDSGEVGIGITTPSYTLDVAGDINLTGTLYDNATPFVTGYWTQDGNDISYSTGNVGINDASPDYKLEVLDTSTQLTLTYADTSTYTEFFTDASGDLYIKPSGGNIVFNNAYIFPSNTPSDNQILKYNTTTGLLTWEADVSGAGFDATAIDAVTWSDGNNVSNQWTFDVSGTDHTMTAGSGLMTFSNDLTVGEVLRTTSLTINSAYSLPAYDGSADYVLKTDGSGTLTWATDIDTDTTYSGGTNLTLSSN